jgi:hypothetical protein
MTRGTIAAAEVGSRRNNNNYDEYFINKKGAKRPPARLSGLPLPLTMTVLSTFDHAGVRNVTQVSPSSILRERKNYLKKREFGGGGGVK